MKKLFFTLGLACLFMVACNNTPKQQETETPAPAKTETCEQKHECPMEALKAEFANWETMTDEAKAELNKKACEMFAEMDAKKAECQGEVKEACEKMVEMTEEQKAECEKKCAEMKAKWDSFANLSVDEQKDLIMERLGGCGHGDKPCCKGEGEGHQCQHEGEEGHQCQHGK